MIIVIYEDFSGMFDQKDSNELRPTKFNDKDDPMIKKIVSTSMCHSQGEDTRKVPATFSNLEVFRKQFSQGGEN